MRTKPPDYAIAEALDKLQAATAILQTEGGEGTEAARKLALQVCDVLAKRGD